MVRQMPRTSSEAPSVRISGRTRASIAASIEQAVRDGALPPGAPLPPVRALAERLSVSTSTVSDAYRSLRQRGVIRTDGRRGTTVARTPPVLIQWSPLPLDPRLRNLADGNPDPSLLPSLEKALARTSLEPALYGSARKSPDLVRAFKRELKDDGLAVDDLAIVAGAIDGIGRVLAANLAPGDTVAVEDPTFPPLFDLLSASGLEAVSVAMDRDGPRPDSLERALRKGATAFVVTSRAQNPTGAAVSADRRRELQRVLHRHVEVLVIEDDTGGLATDDDLNLVCDPSRLRWAFVQSLSMIYGPDVRTGVVAADQVTLSRLEGRQWITGGWVSHILQRLVWTLLKDSATKSLVKRARRTYADRRRTLVEALSEHGTEVASHSGFNVWIPVTRESTTVALLESASWAVASGEPFRLESGPGIRVTASTLDAAEAVAFADALTDAAAPRATTYAG